VPKFRRGGWRTSQGVVARMAEFLSDLPVSVFESACKYCYLSFREKFRKAASLPQHQNFLCSTEFRVCVSSWLSWKFASAADIWYQSHVGSRWWAVPHATPAWSTAVAVSSAEPRAATCCAAGCQGGGIRHLPHAHSYQLLRLGGVDASESAGSGPVGSRRHG
jgi:hypothetical protein